MKLNDFVCSVSVISYAELHQYKHHIELFNQLTQKLIAVYQQDDRNNQSALQQPKHKVGLWLPCLQYFWFLLCPLAIYQKLLLIFYITN